MDSPEDQEELVLWLLGELPPHEAERVARRWEPYPEEVERWRRFLHTTDSIGSALREHAERIEPSALPVFLPSTHSSRSSNGLATPEPVAHAHSISLFTLLKSTVPRHLVPVAVLTPVVVVLLLWIGKILQIPAPAGSTASIAMLSPMVRVFDQGVRMASGPVKVGAQVQLQGSGAAARFDWLDGKCQAVVTGEVTLLLTEPGLGLMHQQGHAVYDIMAGEKPLHLWTSEGTVEIAEARIQLTGTSSYLSYAVLEGTLRMPGDGGTLAQGSTGQWGRLSDSVEFAFDSLGRIVPGSAGPNLASAEVPTTPALRLAALEQTEAEPLPAASTDYDAPPNAEQEESSPSHVLSGTVTRTDNSPVEGARIDFLLLGRRESMPSRRDGLTTWTGSDGHFHLRNLPETDAASLRVQHDSLVPQSLNPIEVVLDTHDIHVLLFEPSSIAGRILPPEGTDSISVFKIDLLAGRSAYGREWTHSLDDRERERLEIRTQADLYTIRGLASGTYRIRVSTDQGETGESEEIELGLEELREGVDIQLVSGGALIGRVIDGRTRDGIADARIRVFEFDPRRSRRGQSEPRANSEEPEERLRSEKDGRFAAQGLKPGRYELRVAARPYHETRTAIQIKAGETTDAVISLFEEVGQVFGKVVDEDNNPISEAKVTATQDLYNPVQGVTDADGHYELNLALGDWSLRAQAPGDRSSWARETVRIEDPQPLERNFVLLSSVRVHGTVTHQGQPTPNLRVSFASTRSWRSASDIRTDTEGRYEIVLRQGEYLVYAAGQRRAALNLFGQSDVQYDIAIADNLINGTVTDAETGEALSHARVILEDLAGNADNVTDFLRRSRFEHTNKNGFYEFRSVEPGSYRLRASAETYTETLVSGIRVPEDEETVLNVPLALTAATALLEVQCKDADTGEPVSGVLAWNVVSHATDEEILVSARPRVSARDGFYLITNLRPGTYTMTFMQVFGRGHYLPATYPGVRVTAEESAGLEVELKQGGAIRALVRRATAPEAGTSDFPDETGIPIPAPGATVRLEPSFPIHDPAIPLSGTADTDGRVTFSPLPEGEYSLIAEFPGHSTAAVSAGVLPGQTTEPEVILIPAE